MNLSLVGRTLIVNHVWMSSRDTLSWFGLGLREFLGELKLSFATTFGMGWRKWPKHVQVGMTVQCSRK